MQNEYVINNQIPENNVEQLANVVAPMLAGQIDCYVIIQRTPNGIVSWHSKGLSSDCIGMVECYKMTVQANIIKDILDSPVV